MPQQMSVLLIDDDPGFRTTLVDILDLKGYTVFAADQGAAALDLLACEECAVALIDLQLSDTSGLELMKRIKQLSPATECIVVTGYASQSSAIEAVNLGAYGYLQKPYDVEQLLLLIRRAFEKRQAEHERRLLEERLRHGQKLEAVGMLAGGIAHDFNNLLTAIFNSTALLRMSLGASDLLQELEIIEVASQRAADMTNQLLAFSQRQVLQPRPMRANEVIGRMEKMLRRLIGEHIRLEIALTDAVGWIHADPSQIEQVILNLAVNARDAMPEGGTLRIATAHVTLEPCSCPTAERNGADEYLTIMVSDTGVGMDEETQRRAFEPFFTTKERGKGTGLGLATVQGIISQSGGTLSLRSTPGFGSEFRITFPLRSVPLSATYTAVTLDSGAPPIETLLVVEDDDLVREAIEHVLVTAGYTTLTARHGLEAITIARRAVEPIDLLLTDMVLPDGTSGRQLGELFRGLYPEIALLYMSGYLNDPSGNETAIDQVTLVRKPFHPDELTQAIRTALDARLV